MKRLLALAFISTIFSITTHAGCEREPRVIPWEGKAIDIDIPMSPSITRIMLPEKDLRGFQPSVPNGILYGRPNKDRIPNQIVLSASEKTYRGLVLVDGESGETYTFNIIENDGNCDSQVKIIAKEDEGFSKLANRSSTQTGAKKHSLVYYMFHEKVPRGFRRQEFDGDLSKRLVYEMGSVKIYAESQYLSRNATGTIFKAINHGREAFKVDLPTINFNSDIKSVLGDVAMISMMPTSMVLGPAPEKAAELYVGPQNYGYIFVVSKR